MPLRTPLANGGNRQSPPLWRRRHRRCRSPPSARWSVTLNGRRAPCPLQSADEAPSMQRTNGSKSCCHQFAAVAADLARVGAIQAGPLALPASPRGMVQRAALARKVGDRGRWHDAVTPPQSRRSAPKPRATVGPAPGRPSEELSPQRPLGRPGLVCGCLASGNGHPWAAVGATGCDPTCRLPLSPPPASRRMPTAEAKRRAGGRKAARHVSLHVSGAQGSARRSPENVAGG